VLRAEYVLIVDERALQSSLSVPLTSDFGGRLIRPHFFRGGRRPLRLRD